MSKRIICAALLLALALAQATTGLFGSSIAAVAAGIPMSQEDGSMPSVGGAADIVSAMAPLYGANGKFIAPISGIESGSEPISSVADFGKIRNNLDGKFHLTQNVDFSGIEWEPIGPSADAPFTGTFDGQGYVLSNFKVTGDRSVGGLFGYTSSAAIKNAGLEGIQINIDTTIPYSSNSLTYAGGIIAYDAGPSTAIYNCYNTGDVTATASYSYSRAGGMVGTSSAIAISYCYNTGAVSARSHNGSTDSSGGGICGYDSSPTIIYCYNSGSISAVSERGTYAGGIVGNGSSKTISNCYNTGAVSASTNYTSCTGGIVGSGGSMAINNCYNVGNISAGSGYLPSYAGGISGNASSMTISNCYNTGDTTATYAGKIVGYIYESASPNISYCYWNTDGNPLLSVGVGYGPDTSTTGKTMQEMRSQGFVDLLNAHRGDNAEWLYDSLSSNNGYPYFEPVFGSIIEPHAKARILATVDGVAKFNGRNTIVTAFQVMSEPAGLELSRNQNLSLAYDNSVLQLIRWDAASAINEAAITTAFNDVVGAANVPSAAFLDGVANAFQAAKAVSGDIIYLTLEPRFLIADPFVCGDEYATLQQIRFALREGKSIMDLEGAVRLMDVGELGALGSVLGLRTEDNELVFGSVTGGPDTLGKPSLEFPKGVTVSGIVRSYCPKQETTVRLLIGSEEQYSAMISGEESLGRTDRSFAISDVAPGTYTLEIAKPGHLKLTVTNVAVGTEDYSFALHSLAELQIMALRCGDINGDGRINSTDLGLLLLPTNYNRFTPPDGGADPIADFNGDDRVNSTDLAIMLDPNHYNRQESTIDAGSGLST